MTLPKNYQPAEIEPRLEEFWQETGIYHFDPQAAGPVYSIDTPLRLCPGTYTSATSILTVTPTLSLALCA